MFKSDLCDYSDAYIIVKWTIDLLAASAASENNKVQKILDLKRMLHLGHAYKKLTY